MQQDDQLTTLFINNDPAFGVQRLNAHAAFYGNSHSLFDNYEPWPVNLTNVTLKEFVPSNIVMEGIEFNHVYFGNKKENKNNLCQWEGRDLIGCTANNTIWDGIHFKESHFKHSVFSQVTFRKSRLTNMHIIDSSLHDTTFENCCLRNVKFNGYSMRNVTFNNCVIFYSSFEVSGTLGATFNQCTLLDVTLYDRQNKIALPPEGDSQIISTAQELTDNILARKIPYEHLAPIYNFISYYLRKNCPIAELRKIGCSFAHETQPPLPFFKEIYDGFKRDEVSKAIQDIKIAPWYNGPTIGERLQHNSFQLLEKATQDTGKSFVDLIVNFASQNASKGGVGKTI